MISLKHASAITLLVASTALQGAGLAVSGESMPQSSQSCATWSWTLDDGADWGWKVSWSFFFRRWVWGYCYGYGTYDYGWRCCYPAINLPESPRTDIPVELSAPWPTGDPPALPPPGAPTGPAPTNGPTVAPIILP